MNSKSKLSSLINFERELQKHLQKKFSKAPRTAQRILKKSIFYTFKGKSSHFRPRLCFATTKILGQNPKKILPWALALEMVHTGSLIHDDMPCMDYASFRRGQLCNHLVFGEDVALLAGTALFIESFSVLKSSLFDKNRKDFLELLISTIGFQGLMSGQVLDLKERSSSKKEILNTMHLKTGVLISACVLGPGFLWADSSQQKALEKFSKNLGLAYQLADDYQDEKSVQRKWLFEKGMFFLKESSEALNFFGKKSKDLKIFISEIKRRFILKPENP
ncbi:MAG: polyprenyl synthetase family protein [Bdellovibrionales bacterium]|nr:polyprenyl synthetase family protein [Bdellovibrionales bacterium]